MGPGAALDGKPRRLVEHKEILVLIERHALEKRRSALVRGLTSAAGSSAGRVSKLSGGMRISWPSASRILACTPAAIDAHLAGARELVEIGEVNLRQMDPEPAVEADAVFLARNVRE